MENKIGLYAVIGVLVVGLLALGGYVFTKNNSSSVNTTTPSPTVSTQNNPTNAPTNSSSSPTPQATKEISGKITAIKGMVGYKNSLVIEVAEGAIKYGGSKVGGSVYVTSETIIYDSNNRQVTKASLVVGQTLNLTVIPAEGGYEAVDIHIK